MKLLLVFIFCVTFVALTANVIAGETAYLATDNEPLYGTWVNMDYVSRPSQKVIMKVDGTFEASSNVDSKEPDWRGRYLITGRWNDSQGNIMYKTHWVGNWGEEAYSLHKISNSGNTRESVWNHSDYPKNIDPKNTYYQKYFRK